MGPWAANPAMGSTQIWSWLIGSKPHQQKCPKGWNAWVFYGKNMIIYNPKSILEICYLYFFGVALCIYIYYIYILYIYIIHIQRFAWLFQHISILPVEDFLRSCPVSCCLVLGIHGGISHSVAHLSICCLAVDPVHH